MGRAATIFATFVMALLLLPTLAAAATAPGVEYSTPSPIRNEEATLRFSINPQGLETSYEVEIARVGQSLKSWGMPTLVSAGEDPVAIEVNVPRYFEGGLSPGTEYHWRITAWSDDGKTVGTEQFFTTTDGPKPIFSTVTASQTGSNRVRFTGTVNPEGALLTDCSFRWVGKTIFTNAGFEKWAAVEMVRFGETVPCDESVEEIGSGTEPVPVAGEVTGLAPGEYVFRVEGEDAFGGLVSGKGAPFAVSADLRFGSTPAPESHGPPLLLAGSPMHASCPRTHGGKAHHRKRANGRKHRRAKKHRHGRLCSLQQ